jgi:hypothetical protein
MSALMLSGLPLRFVSWVVFKLMPGRGATKLAEFSHTEAGSGLDMLEAVERTGRREMRLRYYRHAMDELKHSRMFRERAQALSAARGRTQAVLEDAGYISSQGIRSKVPIFDQYDEIEFLSFVWVHERRGAEQFEVYSELMREDPHTTSMFEEIARDERFHISYSAAELERYRQKGEQSSVRWSVLRVRGRRFWQAWLRFSHLLGQFMSGLWLGLFYLVLIGPFSLIARIAERRSAGLREPEPSPFEPAQRARMMV